MFIGAPARCRRLHQLEVRIGDDEPLRADALEIDLDAGVSAAAFAVQHDAFAELVVPDALPEPNAEGLGGRGVAVQRPGNDQRRTHLLEQLRRYLADEARRRREALLAVQPPVLGIGEVALALRARDADVAEPPLLLEAFRVVQ